MIYYPFKWFIIPFIQIVSSDSVKVFFGWLVAKYFGIIMKTIDLVVGYYQ